MIWMGLDAFWLILVGWIFGFCCGALYWARRNPA
jgi:hypothetical protein